MFSESRQIVWNFASSLSVTDRVQEHNNNRVINNFSFNFIIVKTLVNVAQKLWKLLKLIKKLPDKSINNK